MTLRHVASPRVVAAVLAVALLALGVAGGHAGLGGGLARASDGNPRSASAASVASGVPPTATESFQPELGMPATDVVTFGISAGSGEVWAVGQLGNVPAIVNGKPYAEQQVLLDHTQPAGWQIMPLTTGPEEHPIGGVSGGEATWDGGLVLLAGAGFVTRDPGGPLQPVSSPASGTEPHALLGEDEKLPPAVSTPYAAIEDGERTGLLVIPSNDGESMTAGVLHYDGTKWTREQIEVPKAHAAGFAPVDLACGRNSTTGTVANCWLLAAYKSESSLGAPNRLALFRRVEQEPTGLEQAGYTWEEAAVENPGSLLGEAHSLSGETLSVTALPSGTQMLTVTTQGVWVDFQARLGDGSATDVSKLIIPASPPQAEVTGTWCFPTGTFCTEAQTLGMLLPAGYRSFAWPGSGKMPGSRIITGLPNREMLELPSSGGGFVVTAGAGGEAGADPGAAAFSEPQQGWIADGVNPARPEDGQGQPQVIQVTNRPTGDQLQEEAVPFRHPLYAVAQSPGSTPGDPGAQAIAVGEKGQVAHFIPGQGWRSEALDNSAGEAQPPTMLGVAWPEPGRAYAVGDGGAMWLWRAESGLWEPDPAKPLNFVGNLAAIAFSPTNPDRGFAVGRQGVLLRFGKSWEQEALPPELREVNFTSVTFAGEQAIASYRTLGGGGEVGGLAVQEGSGPWHVEPKVPSKVFSKVAGLPDGGAVAAGPGLVIERESATAEWQLSPQPLPEAQNISALAAYRDSAGAVRAFVSIDLDAKLNPENSGILEYSPYKIDVPRPTSPGQPPPLLPPDLLPNSGYLLKQTAAGSWSDMEHQALPALPGDEPDLPARPDPVLALLVYPNGEAGLAVGGQSGDIEGGELNPELNAGDVNYQTAAAMRFPAGTASANGETPAQVQTQPGAASFVVAGGAACTQPCEPFANDEFGPDVDLKHAMQMANRVSDESPGGLRAFLYAGGGEEVFANLLSNYEESLPAYGPEGTSTAASLEREKPEEQSAYSFVSAGVSGSVKVIVLDFSTGGLGADQEAWLTTELEKAEGENIPAIVVGSATLGFELPNGPGAPPVSDGSQVAEILVEHHASAYFFDYPESNVEAKVSYGTKTIPAYGTGTMGYIRPPKERDEADLLGSSGFLLAEVDTSERSSSCPAMPAPCNVVPVTAKVVPNIAQLALDATNGLLLRRSQVSLFEALARRPLGGVKLTDEGQKGVEPFGPDPYDQIPFDCLGANCPFEVPSEYTFRSSNPDIGNFVAHDPTSGEPLQVLLGSNKLPVPDEHSGLFCPYNEGTTIVSVTAGGLTYSEPVIVQGGSVEYPCGTVPLKNPPSIQLPAKFNFAPIEPAPAGSPPTSPLVQSILPPAAPTPVHPKPHHAVHGPPPLAAVPFAPPVSGANLAIVPPPPTPVAEPTPPSGTSQVSATSPEQKREEERALEMSANMQAVAYDANSSSGPSPWLALMLLVIAAGAGVGMRRGRRSPERSALALATVRRRKR